MKFNEGASNLEKSSQSVTAVVLAAGMGTRMKSDLPKVLHEVCGKPMVVHVIEALKNSGVNRVGLVLSNQLELFQTFLDSYPDLEVCVQEKRRGTGDAVASSAVFFEGVTEPHYSQLSLRRGNKKSVDHVIICAGDTPALDHGVLREFIEDHIKEDSSVSVLGMDLHNPSGYGRLVTDSDGNLSQIVEHKDSTDDQLKITVCNTGVILAKTDDLFSYLDQLNCDNAQGEYYLTDIIAIAKSRSRKVRAFITSDWESFMGVNTLEQKKEVENFMRNL